MVRLLAIPAVLIALLAAAMAWSAGGSHGRADVAFVLKGDHITLDLNQLSYAIDIRLANSLWEGLYMPDTATLKPHLATADRATASPDRRTWTFHIRPGAKWSNGEAVTAADFLFAWRRMLESPGPYSYLHTNYIRGAKAYALAWEIYAACPADAKPPKPDFNLVGERANADGTLTLELVNPVPFLPDLLGFAPYFPLHEPSMRPFAQSDPATGRVQYDPRFTQPPHLVTNGPYRLGTWEFKRRVRLNKSDYYWDKANVRGRTVDEIRADDGLAAYRLYEQHDVDFLIGVDPDVAAPLYAARRPDLRVFKGFGTVFFEFNCLPKLPDGTANPLADVRVRRALSMALDKTQITRNVGRLGQPVATTYVPPDTFPGYTSPPGQPFDPAAARRLLASAGYPGGRGFPRVAITYATEASANGDIATIARRQWADHLGISVDPAGMENRQSAANLHSQNYSIARTAWYGDYFDVSTFTDKYLSASENNAAKWADPAYDALCGRAAVETDPAKRLALFHDAESRLLDQCPILPLYTDVNTYINRGNVHGLAPNAQAMILFKDIWTDRAAAAAAGDR